MYDLDHLYIKIQECPPNERLVDHFPELAVFSEFLVCTDDMIRIAILSGDPDSPFVRIKERESMIRSIFEYLRIDVKTNLSMFEKIVRYRHEIVVNAWLRYIQIVHDTLFTNWILTKRDYEFFIAQTNEPKSDKETNINYYKRRNESRDMVEELGEKMMKFEAKLFPDSKAAREAALAESRMKIRLHAERHAEPYTYI